MSDLKAMRNRPNFFMIGAAKSATTRIHYLLRQHPEIFGSKPKEPHFFSENPPSAEKVAQYLELFHDVGGAKAIGESSMGYSRNKTFPGTAKRLWEFNPGAKIIYVVRHPLRRIESYWIQMRWRDYAIPSNFCEAVRSDSCSLIEATRYWEQLSEYRQFFPDEQILLLFFEEYVADEAAVMRRIFEFLEVDPDFDLDISHERAKNQARDKTQATPLLAALDSRRVWPWYRSLEDVLHPRLKRKLRSFLYTPIQGRPKWDEQTWRWTREQLRADNEKFLAHTGKPADFWDWELKPEEKL